MKEKSTYLTDIILNIHLVFTESRRIFPGLKSRYITCDSCKTVSPRAESMATLILVSQDRG